MTLKEKYTSITIHTVLPWAAFFMQEGGTVDLSVGLL